MTLYLLAYLAIGLCLAIGIAMEELDRRASSSVTSFLVCWTLWPAVLVVACGYFASKVMR